MMDDEPREYEEAMKLRMDSAREDQSIKWNQKRRHSMALSLLSLTDSFIQRIQEL